MKKLLTLCVLAIAGLSSGCTVNNNAPDYYDPYYYGYGYDYYGYSYGYTYYGYYYY